MSIHMFQVVVVILYSVGAAGLPCACFYYLSKSGLW